MKGLQRSLRWAWNGANNSSKFGVLSAGNLPVNVGYHIKLFSDVASEKASVAPSKESNIAGNTNHKSYNSNNNSSSSSNGNSESKLWRRNSSAWGELRGCRQFTNGRDMMNILEGLNYESFEPVLDMNLAMTDRWAVKFENGSLASSEVSKFNRRINENGNHLYSNLSMSKIAGFSTDLLPSSVGIDNTCIRLRLAQANVDAKDLLYFFESFKLHHEHPVTIVMNGKRHDPTSVRRTKWSSAFYVVQFQDATEAQRAVFEKCFSVISGVKTPFDWYDI